MFLVKKDSWKISVIYFMQICNTCVLLVSSGKILCDLICVCSDDSRTNTHDLDTRIDFMIYDTLSLIIHFMKLYSIILQQVSYNNINCSNATF